jgi:catechol 2,3-dioxygenase-like lactoylglutathione lyase family enzyme
MKLEFLFVPTSDLSASLAFYRDGLGFTEVWREGDATVALTMPGTDVQLMLDAHDPDAPLGPLFVVDSVEAFHAARAESITVVAEPSEIPGGFLATYQEPGGATIYVMDQSTDPRHPAVTTSQSALALRRDSA